MSTNFNCDSSWGTLMAVSVAELEKQRETWVDTYLNINKKFSEDLSNTSIESIKQKNTQEIEKVKRIMRGYRDQLHLNFPNYIPQQMTTSQSITNFDHEKLGKDIELYAVRLNPDKMKEIREYRSKIFHYFFREKVSLMVFGIDFNTI